MLTLLAHCCFLSGGIIILSRCTFLLDHYTVPIVTVGDFYTLDFTSPNNLSFHEQGKQLAQIIQAVYNATGKKVILVGHSMGGLAARAYLQGFTTVSRDDAASKVQSLITVGTPHNGSDSAYVCQNALSYISQNSYLPPSLDPLVRFVQSLSFCQGAFKKGMESLKPPSEEIFDLNNGLRISTKNNNLPSIPILSIVIGGKVTISAASPTFVELGDGIVTTRSQDLTQLTGQGALRTLAQLTVPDCMASVLIQTHTCEAHDKTIWAQILSNILGTPLIPVMVSTNAPSVTQTTTPQTVIQGEVSFQNPLTNTYFQYGTSPSSLNLPLIPTQPLSSTSGTMRALSVSSENMQPLDTTSSGTTQFSATLPNTLQPGTTYYYQLVAETGGGAASGGQTVVGQVHEVSIPPVTGIGDLLYAPTLSPASGTTSQTLTPTLRWDMVAAPKTVDNPTAFATSYRIMLAQDETALPVDPTDGNCDRCLVDEVIWPTVDAPIPSYTPPDGLLTPGTTYYWQVHARSPDNFGAWRAKDSSGAWVAASNFSTVPSTPAAILPAPTLSTPADNAIGQSTLLTLNWTPVTNATSYRIMIAPTADALTTDPASAFCSTCVVNDIVTSTQGTSYVPGAGVLAGGSTYYWSVKARSPDSYGAWSTPVQSFETGVPTGCTIAPIAQSVTLGATSITFTALCSGGSPTSYVWTLDGISVGNATNTYTTASSLGVGPHTVAFTASYTGGASNSTSTTLTVGVVYGVLNDTGIDFCGDAATNSASCATVGADAGTYPRQDARFGRDAAAAAGQLTKVGGGGKGFDYTKIANNGSALPSTVALGNASTDWACTRDNVTGLTWEVKTTSGLRSQSYSYTWYNSNPATNGGAVGTASGGSCFATGRCDTEKFVADVNAAGLCGYNDWRMPKVKELEGIADFGRTNPAIDPTYFPNTPSSNFWSGSPYAYNSSYAWNVNFNDGYANNYVRSSGYGVRLVRGGQ